MKITEKIDFLKENYYFKWQDTHKIVEDEFSDKQLMRCVCGRLATGLHESNCKKFHDKVNAETVKRLIASGIEVKKCE